MYTLENKYPVPEITGRNKYPFSTMEPGQSFFVEADQARKARTAARVYMNRHPKLKFCWKAAEGGIRIWRAQ